MELFERSGYLDLLQKQFDRTSEGEGHCIFISGEAGLGKTSLIKAFCRDNETNCNIYQGACDSLFAPRPLAPLYDIMWQVTGSLHNMEHSLEDRSRLFSEIFHELSNKKEKTLIVFEDIHWADEATLDFIKFLGRRITRIKCLFLLTYRDNEIHPSHPLRNVFGQIPPAYFTRLELTPLSRHTVEIMAAEKGYSGEDVYIISGGNPFYVSEILSSYSAGIPENIKDSVLSVYNRQLGKTKQLWELLSVIPTSLELTYLEMFEPLYESSLQVCIESKILLVHDGHINFKHELFRRTIENSLSPLKRISLNKKILELLMEIFEKKQEIERIIHHAKHANEYDIVVRYAPVAAKQAASVGSHIEASRLYHTAIEYYQGNDRDLLIEFYEGYAYECYLTNQIREAIVFTTKALEIRKKLDDAAKLASCMRFLSRLWWLDDNRKYAEKFATEAIDVLDSEGPSSAKAMNYSNMSQLKMLSDQFAECISWGEKAIAIAEVIGDQETLTHALNNVGSVQMYTPELREEGINKLHKSLDIALKNSYHEHAARAYSNLASNFVQINDFVSAKKILDEGIQYCEERDLNSWRLNMLSVRAKMNLIQGEWENAFQIATSLVNIDNILSSARTPAQIIMGLLKMRRGEDDALLYLDDAFKKSCEVFELQRIIPALIALLEYEWLTGRMIIHNEELKRFASLAEQSIYTIEINELSFWLNKAGRQPLRMPEIYEGFNIHSIKNAQKAGRLWQELNCPYNQALTLFEGNEMDKKESIVILQKLGANAVSEKMKLDMRKLGIKKIPRGLRKKTQSNPALLTDRELDVLKLLSQNMQNKEIASKLFISAKTVDHHITSILFKLDVNTRQKAVKQAADMGIIH